MTQPTCDITPGIDLGKNRRAMITAAIVALVAILVGNLLPPVIIFGMKMIPQGKEYHTTMVAQEAIILDPTATVPAGNGGAPTPEPHCLIPEEITASCYQATGPSTSKRTTTTSTADKFMETNVDSLVQVSVKGVPVAEMADHQRLNRDSAYPVADPVAKKTVSVPALGTGVRVAPHVQEGLQPFFPFAPERRSYLYSDQLISVPVSLDYVGTKDVEGIRTYEYSAETDPTNLFTAIATATMENPNQEELAAIAERSVPELFQMMLDVDAATAERFNEFTKGPAQRYYSEEEMQYFGYLPDQQLTMVPFYHVKRSFFVEPKTGTVLDQSNYVHIYFAPSDLDAKTLADENMRNINRVMFEADYRFDETTKASQLDLARPKMLELRALQVFAWIAGVVAFIAIAVFVALLICRRRAIAKAEA
ncbi:porin PorA family protein [Corynebacterium breve]|uniref:Porin PorA family protein n=1 Tax=Corynebacterium breve TaxID=3049799 RepID=A0ABY8VEG8_9CORY|nr:porin PorA family protein [Corynebacterium breve]WIM67492.1 porin PorA family protein [Corynebacterium breve]